VPSCITQLFPHRVAPFARNLSHRVHSSSSYIYLLAVVKLNLHVSNTRILYSYFLLFLCYCCHEKSEVQSRLNAVLILTTWSSDRARIETPSCRPHPGHKFNEYYRRVTIIGMIILKRMRWVRNVALMGRDEKKCLQYYGLKTWRDHLWDVGIDEMIILE
jgi:hypothetical protein